MTVIRIVFVIQGLPKGQFQSQNQLQRTFAERRSLTLWNQTHSGPRGPFNSFEPPFVTCGLCLSSVL